jgi:hypothetical protein
MQSEVARLAKERKMSPKWALRAQFAADLLPRGLCITDIGCGTMDLERFARPREYRPIDRFAWDERTRIIDLNATRLPADWLKGCDVATLLGVLEYLVDPRSIFETVSRAGCAVLFTYHPTDLGPADRVRDPGWCWHASTAELETMLADSGLAIAKRVTYADAQRVYLCHPAGRPPEWIARPAQYTTVSPKDKPTLVVTGFYARGNCGDESLLQCVCEAMQSDFEILISLDEHGAYQGYWDWYPYNHFDRVHQTDLGMFRWSEKYAGLLVGGGGLPFGFAAHQAVHARTYQAATALAGVDFSGMDGDPRLRGHAQRAAFALAARQYANLFDFRALRTRVAVESAAAHGVEYFHGADWALRLVADQDPSVERNDRRALIVLREMGLRSVSYRYVQEISVLISALEERGFEPHFLPFAPEDERFLGHIGLEQRIPVIRTWWNPRRAKQWIASSGLVLSLGRLHPLIFAAPTSVPVACLLSRSMLQPKAAAIPDLAAQPSKLTNVCRELGIALFFTVEDTLAGLSGIRPADSEKVASSMARLDAMIERLRELFRESAASRANAPVA